MPVFKFKEFPPKELAKILSEAGIPFNFIQLQEENGDFFWLWNCPDDIVEKVGNQYNLKFQLDNDGAARGCLKFLPKFDNDLVKEVKFTLNFQYKGLAKPEEDSNQDNEEKNLQNYEYQALVLKYIEILNIYIAKLKQQEKQESVARKNPIRYKTKTSNKLEAMQSALEQLTCLSKDKNHNTIIGYYNSFQRYKEECEIFDRLNRYTLNSSQIKIKLELMSNIIEDYHSKIEACLNTLKNKTDVLQETRDSILMEFAKTALTLGMIHIYRLCKTHLLGQERTESMQHYSMFKKEFEALEKKYTPTPKNG